MADGAIKFDAGKPGLVLGTLWRFPRAITEVAKVSQIGVTKYALAEDDTNYMNVPNGYFRYTNALGRHLVAERLHGEMNVEKGGFLPEEGVEVLHAAQVAWNALARLEILLAERERDANI